MPRGHGNIVATSGFSSVVFLNPEANRAKNSGVPRIGLVVTRIASVTELIGFLGESNLPFITGLIIQ